MRERIAAQGGQLAQHRRQRRLARRTAAGPSPVCFGVCRMSPNLHATRIMLADDHAVVRLACGCCSERRRHRGGRGRVWPNGPRACMAHWDPDVLVMVISMPGIGGLGVGRILNHAPRHGSDALGTQRRHHATRALAHGARATCATGGPDEFCAQSLRWQKTSAIDPELAARWPWRSCRNRPAPWRRCPRRSWQSFSATGSGRSMPGGRRLSPEPQHRGHPPVPHQAKLNVQNAAELALVALRNGMIDV